MKAGKTNYEVNTRIRITFIDDKESKELEGKTGTLTHPFNGLMSENLDYIAGVYLDVDKNSMNWNYSKCNLTATDKFVIID